MPFPNETGCASIPPHSLGGGILHQTIILRKAQQVARTFCGGQCKTQSESCVRSVAVLSSTTATTDRALDPSGIIVENFHRPPRAGTVTRRQRQTLPDAVNDTYNESRTVYEQKKSLINESPNVCEQPAKTTFVFVFICNTDLSIQ